MAARNRRKRRGRGRFGFLYKVLSVILILAAILGGCIVFFRVDEIQVMGSSSYTDEQIIAASGVERGDNLFLVNQLRAADRIVEQLPYINEVNPRIALPDALIFTVTECTPVGVLKGEDGVWWVVDSRCKLLERGGSELSAQYPQITGLTALMPSEGSKLAVSVEESAKLDSLKQVLSALEARDMLSELQGIDMSAVSEIRMTYEERFSVRLPMYSDDFHRLIHTLEKAAEALNAGQTGTIDLTGEKARFVPN